MKTKKNLTIVVVAVGILFIVMQFFQPQRSNPIVNPAMTMQQDLNMPSHIALLFEKGCKDCHSNKTQWPWYAYVAPVSWLIADDVNEGRKHFNMSEWGTYSLRKKGLKLSTIQQVMEEKSMPLPQYIALHPEASLTNIERDTLSQWARRNEIQLVGDDEE